MKRIVMCVLMVVVVGMMAGPAWSEDDGWLDRQTQQREINQLRNDRDDMENQMRQQKAEMEHQRQEMEQQKHEADRLKMEMQSGFNRYK